MALYKYVCHYYYYYYYYYHQPGPNVLLQRRPAGCVLVYTTTYLQAADGLLEHGFRQPVGKLSAWKRSTEYANEEEDEHIEFVFDANLCGLRLI